MPRYSAAIFDLDGLLVDTERLGIRAGNAALEEMGVPMVAGRLERLIGRDEAAATRLLAEDLGEAFPYAEFMAIWNGHYRLMVADGIPLRPGAERLLTDLSAARLPIALATSSTHQSAHKKLRLTGIDRFFDAVVTVDCVTRPKPAPDPYLLAAERLGQDAPLCIAFEDSDTGAAAARAAGMTVVQIPDLGPATGIHAHHVAEDLVAGARAAGLI